MRRVWHIGQYSRPDARAERLAAAELWSQRVVPVREVVMVVCGGGLCCGVCRAGADVVVVAPALRITGPPIPRGWVHRRVRGVWSGRCAHGRRVRVAGVVCKCGVDVRRGAVVGWLGVGGLGVAPCPPACGWGRGLADIPPALFASPALL